MRTKLFFVLALLSVLVACNKSSTSKCNYATPTTVAPAAEVANLKAYLDANALPYVQHSSGIFFNVITPGTGATPGVCSDVTVKYRGRLTNGTGFDSSYVRSPGGTVFTLGGLIPGWQIGIPLIKKGGSITLYIPPTLGYGAQANGPIPANSNLVFNIELVDVQ
ncbi:MAG: FKBP-type peptidylprolyl isomerase [Ferruginibacter sp.]|nr:FKBP-type peptidylprolyl isomerase [Ferruginibacter sp.]